MIVDAHLHLFERVSDAHPRGTHPLYPADLRAPVDEFVDVMDRAGVDAAVVVPLDHHDEYLAHVLDVQPTRFRGVGVLDDDDPDPAASVVRRAETVGIRGLRIGRLGPSGATDAAQLDLLPLLQRMADLDLIVWFYGPPEQLALLPMALDQVPEVRVVLNHLGFCPSGYQVDRWGRPRIDTPLPPPTLDLACSLAEQPNVHVMFSGQYAFSRVDPPFRDLATTVTAVADAFGFDRLLWASDWPWVRVEPGYERQMGFVDDFFPTISAADRRSVMGENAARLFGLGSGS